MGGENRIREVSAQYLVDMKPEASERAIPVGYKQAEVGVIPEDWKVELLENIATFGGGTTPARENFEKYFADGKHLWIKTTDLNNSIIFSSEEYVTDEALEKTGLKKHPLGSVLVAMYGGFNQIGRTGLLSKDAAINQALLAIKPNKSKLVSEYLLFNLNYRVHYWKGIASSSRKDPNITSNDIKNFLLPLPLVEEQSAIANALSDVDALINELEKLIHKKQAIKTATMQQLLTGKTRLPQFALRDDGAPKGTKLSELGEIPEDWEVKRIEELANVDPENLSSTTPCDYEFEYISLEQVDRGFLLGTSRYTYVTSPSRARRMLQKNDVMISTVRPNLMGHLHVCSEVRDLICSTGFSVVRAKLTELSPGFLYQNLFANIINQQIEMLITGSNYPAINSGDVRRLILPVPTVEEQTTIATILSDMDSEIQALQQRLTKTRQIKQGMMQELLTGKTRLVKPNASPKASNS